MVDLDDHEGVTEVACVLGLTEAASWEPVAECDNGLGWPSSSSRRGAKPLVGEC